MEWFSQWSDLGPIKTLYFDDIQEESLSKLDPDQGKGSGKEVGEVEDASLGKNNRGDNHRNLILTKLFMDRSWWGSYYVLFCVFFVVVMVVYKTRMAPESITDSMALTTAPFIMSPTILAIWDSYLGKEHLQF